MNKVCSGVVEQRINEQTIFIKSMKDNFTFVDLGLPSGRLWATENAYGYYTYDEATEKFEELLPKSEAFQELWEECQWLWDVKNKGMLVIGPNKNTIFLPASGYHDYDYGSIDSVDSDGCYWSYTSCSQDLAYSLGFQSECVLPMCEDFREYGFSVRLCKEQ